jgi:hypothetical protein
VLLDAARFDTAIPTWSNIGPRLPLRAADGFVFCDLLTADA